MIRPTSEAAPPEKVKPKSKKKPKAAAGGSPAAARAAENRDQLAGMRSVVGSLKTAAPASEVIREEEVVPTIFPHLDHRLEVGGLPVGRIVLVHGPSSEGKSPFVIGLGKSFLLRGHFFDWIDAERTTPAAWMRSLMGSLYKHPGFLAPRNIGSYEEVRAHVREWCEGVGRARKNGDVSPETRGVLGLDSIRKLVPKKIWDELAKAVAADEAEEAAKPKKSWRKDSPKGGVDGLGGRAAQIKAAFNAAWTDELVPLAHEHRVSFVIIGRESVEKAVTRFESDVINVGGGRALLFDSSLWLRATDEPIQKVQEKGPPLVFGRRHAIAILRSKVGPRREKYPEAYYHTSNGTVSPEGFDLARDLVELGLELGAVKLAGSYYSLAGDGEVLGNGLDAALSRLRADAGLASVLDQACRTHPGFGKWAVEA